MGQLHFAHCPHCHRGWVTFSKQRMYVRMFTHMRLRHWDHYQKRGKALIQALDGLID